MYGPIIEGFRNRRTMIIAGDRGTGKTAIILDFLRGFDGGNSVVVNVSDYNDLKIGFKSKDFYEFAIKRLAANLFERILEDGKSGRGLTKTDRVLLSYFLHHFVPQATKTELHRRIADIQITGLKRALNWVYGVLRVPLNATANATVRFLSDLITQSTGMASPDAPWKEYFPELALNPDNSFADSESSFDTLRKLSVVTKKLGYKNILFIFDKVDEDQRLSNAAEEIADFIEPIVTDNRFLLADDFQVVISLWVIPFNMLKDKVRTQKIFCPELHWTQNDLVAALNRRIQVFSDNKLKGIADLVDESVGEDCISNIVELSNKNPRDLWHIMHKIMLEHHVAGSSPTISKLDIEKGFRAFVSGFNFYEYYPRKSNAKASSMDIYAYIKHLSKLDDAEFTRNQLNSAAGTGSSTQNYVVGMEGIGLVERCGQQSGNIVYRIRDPKVVFAIKNNVDITRNG